jgi:hypothetical protein
MPETLRLENLPKNEPSNFSQEAEHARMLQLWTMTNETYEKAQETPQFSVHNDSFESGMRRGAETDLARYKKSSHGRYPTVIDYTPESMNNETFDESN